MKDEIEKRKAELKIRREALLAYLKTALTEEDWHGVSDAANDLRCADSELKGLSLTS